MKHYTPYIAILLLLAGWYFHYTHLSSKISLSEQSIVEQKHVDSLRLSELSSELLICQKQLQSKENTNKALIKLVENKPKTREVITYLPIERVVNDTLLKIDTMIINIVNPVDAFGTIITMESEDISTVAVMNEDCQVESFQNYGTASVEFSVDLKSKDNWFWRGLWGKKRWDIETDFKNNSSEIEIKHKIITAE